MTDVFEGGHPRFLRQAKSAAVGKAVTIEIELDGDFRALTHVFLGVKMYDSTGSFAVTVQTENTGKYEAPPTATIDATAPTTIDWAGNTAKIKVVPTGLTDTVSWIVVATANRN
jgi:hypothetical protein